MDTFNILYKYRFDEIYLMRGQEVLHLDWTNIKSFVIHRDYDGYIRPQYEITLQIDNRTYIWISRHQNDFQVYLDIKKVLTDEHGNQMGPTSQFMKGLFIAVNPTSSSISVDRLQDASGSLINAENTNDLTEMMRGSPVNIGLIQREMYNQSMSSCNAVVKKDNLQNIVLSMLTRAGFKKVLMAPFQNYEVYQDIVIPAFPLYKAIQYLDYRYGFYKAGSVIFYDYDTVYVLDSSMKNLVYKANDNPYCNLNVYESTEEIINGHVYGATSRQLYVSNASTSIIDGEDLATSVGSTTTVVNVNTGAKSDVTYDSDKMQYLESKHVIYGSDRVAEYIQQRQTEAKKRVTIAGYHYDVDAFNPNILTTIYHSNAELQSRLTGKYRLSSTLTEIHNQGDNFVSNTTAAYLYAGA